MAYRHKYLVRDDNHIMFDSLITTWWTVAAHTSTYSVDLGVADHDEADPGVVVMKLAGMTSGGSATVAIALQDSADDITFAAITPAPIGLAATAFDDALFSDVLYFPLPDFGLQRYIQVVVTVAVAVLTAGTLSAWYTKRHA
jgi:hypothetical protein